MSPSGYISCSSDDSGEPNAKARRDEDLPLLSSDDFSSFGPDNTWSSPVRGSDPNETAMTDYADDMKGHISDKKPESPAARSRRTA